MLSNVPVPAQSQCGPTVREGMIPNLEDTSLTAPPPQHAAHTLLAGRHQPWKAKRLELLE